MPYSASNDAKFGARKQVMTRFRSNLPTRVTCQVVLALVALAPLNAQADRAYTTLGNGLKVLALQSPGTDLAALALVFPGGAGVERPGQEGWAHLMEHMVWMGHEGAPTQRKFAERGSTLGIIRRSETGSEWLRLMLTLPADSLRPGLAYLLEVVKLPLFAPAELEREKQIVLQELDRLAADPEYHFQGALEGLLYRGRKSPVQGDADAILNASSEKLRLLKLRQLLPNNAGLVIVSPQPPDQVIDLIRLTMSGWPVGFPEEVTLNRSIPGGLGASRDSLIIRPVRNGRITLAWPGPATGDRVATGTALLMAALLEQPGAPFHQALVDNGDILQLQAEYRQSTRSGWLILQITLALENMSSGWNALTAELQRMADPAYLNPADLRSAKFRLEAAHEITVSQPGELAWQMAGKWAAEGLSGRGPVWPDPQIITQQQIFEYLQTYINAKPSATVLLIDKRSRLTARSQP